jgi:phage FluMu protein Com
MVVINGKSYRELRCRFCHKFICYEYIFAGRVAHNCPRCGELNEFTFKHLKNKENSDIVSDEFTINLGEPKEKKTEGG